MQIVTAVRRPLSAVWRLEPFKQEGNEEVSISRCRALKLYVNFSFMKKSNKIQSVLCYSDFKSNNFELKENLNL